MTPIPFLARPYSPDWFTEAEAQLQQIAAEVPCTAELLDTTPTLAEVVAAEIERDNAWLGTHTIISGGEMLELNAYQSQLQEDELPF